jgi:hypothetical protein
MSTAMIGSKPASLAAISPASPSPPQQRACLLLL